MRDGGRWRIRVSLVSALAAAAAAGFAVLFGPAVRAALPPAPDVSGPTSLAGQLLVAAPALRGSWFEHTVILITDHNRDGALGIVINRPLQERPIATILQALGADATGMTGSVRVFVGGPVNRDTGFALHSAEYRAANTQDIDGRVALSAASDVLRDIGLGKGPNKSLVAFGCAGWAAGQIEDEIQHGAWYSVPEDPVLVFDADREKVWSDAVTRRGFDH